MKYNFPKDYLLMIDAINILEWNFQNEYVIRWYNEIAFFYMLWYYVKNETSIYSI